MAEPTADNLTFLFTDIEGSTRLWDDSAKTMRAAHARHWELVAQAIGRHHGKVVRNRFRLHTKFGHDAGFVA